MKLHYGMTARRRGNVGGFDILMLAFSYLLGAAAGYLFRSVSGFIPSLPPDLGRQTVINNVWYYEKLLIPVFFGGYSALGLLIVPAVIGFTGFSASFLVRMSYTMPAGAVRELLAGQILSSLAFLTALFILGVHAMRGSGMLFSSVMGRKTGLVASGYPGMHLKIFLICLILVAAFVVLNLILAPFLAGFLRFH